jgi:Carboxypeptidase regulatory-like domain
MRSTVVRRLLVVGVILALPAAGYAQEATMSGTVTDSTGGVLPGVTVTAVHEASGNTFEAVTDERGTFRIAARTGVFRVTASLPGFGTATRGGLELLVGQQAVVNLQLSPSAVQESVTVTGEAPLIDTTSSSLGGNVDPRQTQELPVNGRDWLTLTTLAPGMRANAVDQGPTTGDRQTNREYQLNMDGQEVSVSQAGGRGQPRFSRDAIAEFQFLSSRFDATMGRSTGVQVNAVSKSGTNTPAGSFSGYFRDDNLIARDFITGTVLPYQNQQLSLTFGGPIRRDKLHFFGNYEYEREPQTLTFNTPYPRFNVELTGTSRVDMGGLRLDYQLSSRTRVMTRWNVFHHTKPYEGGNAGGHPAATEQFMRHSDELYAGLTQVLGNRVMNEVRVGFNSFLYRTRSNAARADHPQAARGVVHGGPRISFTGFAILGNDSTPQNNSSNNYSLRDDFTLSFTMRGRHDVKLGGEYIYNITGSNNCATCMGLIDAQGGPVPDNIEDLIPVWNDVTTWNLAALTPITRRYTFGAGLFRYAFDENNTAAWIQDDWAITPRLTLNIGLRYDLAMGIWANWVSLPPWLEAGRPNDTNNIQPRLGFAYSLNDRTVLRGGYGRYYGELLTNLVSHTQRQTKVAIASVLPDGRPDFAANPFNGPWPTQEQLIQRFCSSAQVPGCVRQDTGGDNLVPPPEYAKLPFSHQVSIGMQRQVGTTMAVEADYVFTGGRDERAVQNNVNITFDPGTGVNYPFNDISRRAFPDWGVVGMNVMGGRSNFHGLQTAFTKRLSQRWQASGTYTLSALRDTSPQPISGITRVPFPVAPDLGGEYTLAITDQRHKAGVNGIWQMGYGFQLSGLYFFGSGARFNTTYGGDRRNTGASTGGGGRLRPDGSIMPRNSLVGHPIHRVDVRLQRRFQVGRGAAVDGILEVYNLFNHANFGSYTTAESNRNFGQPEPNPNISYMPRMLQVGFRATF